MTRHLLLFSVGPVTDFIAQSRRTRDLWFGSHVLSELSRAGAACLAQQGARLIFPALERGDRELQPCDALLRTDSTDSQTPPLPMTDEVLAEIPVGCAPEVLARAARQAVLDRWRQLADNTLRKRKPLLAPGIEAVWREQIETFLEFTATWAPWPETDQGYGQAWKQVVASLQGRHHLRDFSPWRQQRGGVPKSSLDGARETVLADPAALAGEELADFDRMIRRFRIADGEFLDAVGLLKRAGAEPEQFIPIGNVALARWMELAKSKAPDAFHTLNVDAGKAGLFPVRRPDIDWVKTFTGDAQIFLEERWKPLFQEVNPKIDAAAWGKTHVRPILDEMAAPSPYVACLMADGDHMGKTLARLADPDRHRFVSGKLAEFVRHTREIVEHDHRGLLIYGGGDDILAFVCLPDAVSTAQALRQAFTDHVSLPLQQEFSLPGHEAPTLSVGIGIGHLLTHMGELRKLGEEALELAKGDQEISPRDALALLLDKRSGGRSTWRGRWENDPAARLRQDADLLGERLSHKKVFEIQRLLQRLPNQEGEDECWREILKLEVTRILSRVRGTEPITPAEAGLAWVPGDTYVQCRQVVASWIDRMLVARDLAKAIPREREGKTP